jgi:hypothetical protein
VQEAGLDETNEPICCVQRIHLYESVAVGAADHVPGVTVRVRPEVAVPLNTCSVSIAGALVTATVERVHQETEPMLFVPIISALMYFPMSTEFRG